MSSESENKEASAGLTDMTKSLDDQVLKYDMRAMLKQLESEFDAGVYSQELVSQNDISLLFNLKQKKLNIHARN